MLEIFIGQVKTGRLKRLAFLGYSLLLQLLFFGSILTLMATIGAGEHLIGGDLQQAQKILAEWFSIPFIIIFLLLMVLICFVGLNLTAKRIRDTGLPGWLTILAILISEILVSAILSQEASAGLHVIFIAALYFVPTDAFLKLRH